MSVESPEQIEAREKIRSELVQLADNLSESAMQGETIGALVIAMNPKGGVLINMAGFRPTEALGLMQLMNGVLARQLMA
jgi:hypothetical protein